MCRVSGLVGTDVEVEVDARVVRASFGAQPYCDASGSGFAFFPARRVDMSRSVGERFCSAFSFRFYPGVGVPFDRFVRVRSVRPRAISWFVSYVIRVVLEWDAFHFVGNLHVGRRGLEGTGCVRVVIECVVVAHG